MPAKKAFDQQIAAIDGLREAPPKARVEGLRKALGDRNNFIVGKAADLARECNATELTDDLLKAFDRFFENAEKTDPQCWAKNAISRALAAMEYQEPEVFLRGMRHIQLEPVWGGRSDTAGTLRATCSLALVQCRSVREPDLLAHLLDLFADKDKAVRTEIAHAIEQVGSPAAALLLRLRATLGNDEPEVLGACYAGILRIEGASAIRWVSKFLACANDSASEAAWAIAGTHLPEAVDALRNSMEHARDPQWRSTLLSAIALTRQEAALELLLELIRSDSLDSEAAIEAVLRSVPSEEIVNRMEKLITGNPRLERVFSQFRPQR
jgi:hypothetical protein